MARKATVMPTDSARLTHDLQRFPLGIVKTADEENRMESAFIDGLLDVLLAALDHLPPPAGLVTLLVLLCQDSRRPRIEHRCSPLFQSHTGKGHRRGAP